MYKVTLKAARVNKNLTQTQAARRQEISVSTLKNWEKGASYPNQPEIERLCAVYEVPYDLLDFSRN